MAKTKNKPANEVGARHAFGRAHSAARQRARMDAEKSLGARLAAGARRAVGHAQKVTFDPAHATPACRLILVAELVLNCLIVERVPYTEIDWRTYMQQVEGFLNGTLDYSQLRGDTGPCVYPAGHLYIYSLLHYVTDGGRNVRLAQYIFIAIYLTQTHLTHRILVRTRKLPGYALVLCFLASYRIHSIYVLRLFNDPIAVLLFWAALNAFVADRWLTGSALYSLAVSVKMSVLLYAPCLLLAYVAVLSRRQALQNLLVCGACQLAVGLPFLLAHPARYVRASFDLARVFEHRWTVNYRFLDARLFADARFHVALLVLHVSLLALFAPLAWRYFRAYRTLGARFHTAAQLLVLPFFVANLVGVACARSLHYQFYAWYFHSLPYLAFSTPFRRPLALLLLGLLEVAWNVYPSTAWSSTMLHLVHLGLLVGLYKTMRA